MNLRAALARILGVAAIVAVVAFASTAADAHTGHNTGGHVHTGAATVVVALQAPVQAVSVDGQSVRLEVAFNDTAAHDHDTAELRATPTSVPADDSTGCIQGCCAGAPCHSSTACTLGADVSVVLPRDAGMSLIIGTAPGIAGHDPEGLRKPPRTFA